MAANNLNWQRAVVSNKSTVQDAIHNLNDIAIKIVMVVNDVGEFQGTISDGDIRRALLKGLTLNSSITSVVHQNALVVPPDMTKEMVVQLMKANKIHQIPVIDEKRHIVGLHLWDEITTPSQLPNIMVIMAGGKGVRLRPHTEHCPKPLLPIAGKPMLEHIIERAKAEGFSHFILAIHYLGNMIEDYFGDGSKLGIKIEYLRENSPLGTAGALALLSPKPFSPFVVTNGDVMTDIRYSELLDFHIRHAASATMAVRLHEWQHPFGVVQMQGVDIVGFEEKPIARTHINAGVYVLNPEVLSYLSENVPCDMPSLFELLKSASLRTVAYPMHEPWLDVGRPDDLLLANKQTL
jgi:dTDP-glucose pyrophosphorylase